MSGTWMFPTLRPTLRIGCALLGGMWIVAAASKAIDPGAAYEFTARAVGGGATAKALVSATAAGEALLGALMILGAARGLVATAIGLMAATGALVHVRATFGGSVRCGCLALLADSSVDQAIRRNAWMLAGVAALFAILWLSRRAREVPGAAAESGPARSAP